MGSQAIQGKLWGQRPQDWGSIQEQTGKQGYDYVLDKIDMRGKKLLDVGCGTGFFCQLAHAICRDITGIDAAPEFIEEAKKRVPSAQFMVGEMEELPFAQKSFNIVCGFNSFQYAADTKNALREVGRVLADDGQLAVMIWGNKEDCEAAAYLKAVGSLLPPPPPGAAGPFALSENQLLEKTLEEVGFMIINNADISTIWDYPDKDIALRGLMSAGPVARAIESNSIEKVSDVIAEAVQPYTNDAGHVIFHNKVRIVIAKKM